MRTVDNRGQGNCMYYAYAVSLMYWLRQQDIHVRNEVFDKLKPQNPMLLCNIWSEHQGMLNEFNSHELNVIQHQLGPACRALTAEQVRQEFLSHAKSTSTVANCVYGVKKVFKQKIRQYFPGFDDLIELNVTEEHFQHAEIYKVPGLSLAIEAFVTRSMEDISNSVKKTSDIHLSKNDMCTFLQEQTIEFLSAQDYKWLNAYVQHVKTDKKWGTEELLYTLHRAITGENERDISIEILQNGIIHPWQHPEKTDIVLDNRANVHWVSSIPSGLLVSQDKIKAIYNFKQLLEVIDIQLKQKQFEHDLQPHIACLNDILKYYSNDKVHHFVSNFETQFNPLFEEIMCRQKNTTGGRVNDAFMATWRIIKLAFVRLLSMITLGKVDLEDAIDDSFDRLNSNVITAREKLGFFKSTTLKKSSWAEAQQFTGSDHVINNQHVLAFGGME